MKKFTLFRLILSLLFIAALAYFISKIEISKVAELFLKINPLILLFALISFTVAILVKIARLVLIAGYYGHEISFKDSSVVQMVSVSFATLTPGRIGEGVKAVLLNQKRISFTESVSITLFERLFDLLLLGIGAVIFSVLVLNSSKTTIIFAVVTAIFLVMILMLKEAEKIVRLPFLRNLKVAKYIARLKFDWKLSIFPILLVSILVWTFSAGLQYFTLAALDTEISFLLVFGIVCISTMVSIISILPDGIGVADLSIFFLYSIIGVPNEVITSLLIVYRLFGTILPLLATFILIQIVGLDIGKLKRDLKQKYSELRRG